MVLHWNLICRGGVGCISVTANVAAKLCSEFQEASLNKSDENKISKAKEINEKLMPLHKALFIESNPSPVKYAASLLNLSSEEVRLPLVKLTDKTKKEVQKSFKVRRSALMKAKKYYIKIVCNNRKARFNYFSRTNRSRNSFKRI